MPTSSSSLSPDTARAATEPRADIPITVPHHMTNAGEAPAGPKSAIAAVHAALSNWPAARAPAGWSWRILKLCESCWHAFQEQRRRQKLRVVLSRLSERELMDIGVTSTEIDCIAAHRTIDRLRDGTTHPWMLR